MNFFDKVLNVLKSDERYFTAEGELLKNAVYEDAMKMDSSLIKLLLSDDTGKSRFFTEVDGILVFDKVGFGWVINNREFLPDYYTRYKNKIGLTNGNGDYISTSNDVELVFPYKDCVLEGGQTKEDQKRSEIFYNETLAPDEVDRLLYPKVFTNAKRYSKNTVEDNNIIFGTNDNILVKGNNLLVLSSLLRRYEGLIKCIYIDPPYYFVNNKDADTFGYNSNFKLSTWLTFMKDRLLISKRLLSDGGSIWISVGKDGQHYLKVLADEIFGVDCFVGDISWQKTYSPRNDSLGISSEVESILVYSKKTGWKPNRLERTQKMNSVFIAVTPFTEPCRNVTVVRTIFSVFIAVALKSCSAFFAKKLIDRFFAALSLMAVPAQGAALVRAKLTQFIFFFDGYWFSALLTGH